MTRHTLSVLVEDKPGVLTRVASLFARRAFNINSLAVGPTEVPGMSRMTVVVDADGELIEQITKQLNKLVNVIKIVELTPNLPYSVTTSWSRYVRMPLHGCRSPRLQTCSAHQWSTSPQSRWSLRQRATRKSSRRCSQCSSLSASAKSCSPALWPLGGDPAP